MNYICHACGKTYPAIPEHIKCTCGSALWLDFKGRLKKEDIISNDFTLWRYIAAYPIDKDDVVISYNETLTPLTAINFNSCPIMVKQDNLMPTGSFKDRGVSMVLNYVHKFGVKKVAEDSSGNGGSSFAGYCALGGLDLKVFVPAGTSAGKIAQMKVYGADLVEVEGSRSDVTDEAMKNIGGRVYVGHNWHPLFVQGTKSVAYEIWEQNNFKAPDQVVCVAGNGSMVCGLYLGFTELLASGEIDKLPKIFAVQSESCNTLYRGFYDMPLDFEVKPTLAEGISIYRSSNHHEVVEFIKASGGQIMSVSENEIKEALFDIGTYGFYIEPTSATGFAGLRKLIDDEVIKKDEKTVVIISGNGLKATDKILNLMEAK